jgi:6-phosphogluconolactonase
MLPSSQLDTTRLRAPAAPLEGLRGEYAGGMAFWSGWAPASERAALAASTGRRASAHPGVPLYVGTYTNGESRGIYLIEFDPVTAAFSPARLVAEAVNATFLAWHPSRPVLFAVSETDTVAPDRTGALLWYRVEPDGGLALIGEVPSGGAGACHLSLDAEGRHAFVANYGAGSVAVLDVDVDGGVTGPVRMYQHTGHGPHPTRQTAPHAHAIQVAPGGRFVLAADLGADALLIYRWNAATGRLTPPAPTLVQSRPGAGPRHLASHPDGTTMFVINELNSTLSSYEWDGNRGTLRPLSEASTLPGGWSGENLTAEVAVHPSGRFVYASNRGHDSIAVFMLRDDRTLGLVGIRPTGGRTPRHFAIDPLGDFLIAANQESDSLAAFRIDPATGDLTDTGRRATVPSPVCVSMRLAAARSERHAGGA